MGIKIITEEELHKEVIDAIPNYINDLVKVSNNFNKFVNDPNHCEFVEHLFGSIICINEGEIYDELPENILLSLKEKIRMFSKALFYYFEEVDKNIDSALENKSKDNLENMSKEELIAYIKSKENTSK